MFISLMLCYELNVCIPSNPHVEAPNPHSDGIWGWGFGRQLYLDEFMKAGTHSGISFFVRGRDQSSLSLCHVRIQEEGGHL